MRSILIDEVAELSADQKIQLVEDLWDSIADRPATVKIPEWHLQELDKRLKAYQTNPEEGSSWAEVKQRIVG